MVRANILRRVPIPLPTQSDVLLHPPDRSEVEILARGITSAVAPETGLTELQRLLISAVSTSMTGHSVPLDVEPMTPAEFASALQRRNLEFRTRIVQVMVLSELVLVPLPRSVAENVEAFARELGVDEGMLRLARDYAKGNLGLAMIDFERNGYTENWDVAQHEALHTSDALEQAWELCVNDAVLAGRWAALENCPSGSLGRRVFDFYRARGFTFPGMLGSAPPLLAQHDWVHVLADYGTRVESELEVFAFIARAIPDPRGFSLLAMVISLFQTGYMRTGAGLFEYSQHHLEQEGMPARVGDAMYRGANCGRDLLAIDWFEYADMPLDEARRVFNIVPKRVMDSVGPWEPGGISEFQLEAGRNQAEAEGREYDSFGACL
jgi:hypothetical protein